MPDKQFRRLTAFHVHIPLKRRVKHASHTRDANDTLLVRCELTDGSTGWGEGLPRPYVTGETIDTAWEQVRATEFEQLRGESARPPGVVEMLDSFTLAKAAAAARDCFGNSVRCALELSLLDAVCRTQRVPLSHITAVLPETKAIRRAVSHAHYSGVITSTTPIRQMRSAVQQRLYGLRQCKVKVGVAGQDDVATLRRVRRMLGKGVDLRVDANEAWSCDEVAMKLEELTPFGVTAVEQPVPHAEVSRLAELRAGVHVPIMLDESLCSLSDGRRAIAQGLCDLFNIRLSKCGGFINSLRLAAMARKAGLGYQLGCQVGETGILSAAGRHFATSVGGIRYLEGSYDRHLVAERLTVEDLTFGYGGRAPALTAPGLGITVNAAALARCTVRQQTLWER